MAEKALRAIILFAKLAQARTDGENMLQLWAEPFPIRSCAEPANEWPFSNAMLVYQMVSRAYPNSSSTYINIGKCSNLAPLCTIIIGIVTTIHVYI